METKNVIIYHNNCPDGWCAAFIAKTRYPDAELLPLNHGLTPDDIDQLMNRCFQKDVLMVDYSLRTRELNDELDRVANSLRILDHHKTAQAVLEGATYATFDMKRSGAGLAWDYLFGENSQEWNPADPFHVYRPWWVNYTEDQDLFNWALHDSREINAYLTTMPRTVEAWDAIVKHDNKETARIGGIGVRKYIEYYTRSVLAEAQEGVLIFEGTSYRTAVVNIPYVGVGEAGAELAKTYDIGLAWFERGDGQIQFSLRSDRAGMNVDVSAIAKSLGGGGHRNAAGFQVSVKDGRELVDKVLGRMGYGILIQRCV